MDDNVIYSSTVWTSRLNSVWMVMIGCAFMAAVIPNLSFVGRHGKFIKSINSATKDGSSGAYIENHAMNACNSSSEHSNDELLFSYLERLTVPKSHFMHFYIVGISWGLVTICCRLYFLRTSFGLVAMLMFELHAVRRLYECYYFTIYGDSRIHISGYLAGLAHYVLAPLTLLVASIERESVFRWSAHQYVAGAAVNLVDLFFKAFAIVLFVYANYAQFKCHYILYECKYSALQGRGSGGDCDEIISAIGSSGGSIGASDEISRKPVPVSVSSPYDKVPAQKHHQLLISPEGSDSNGDRSARYALPRGGMFAYVACPHYFFEICSYVAMWMQISTSLTCLLMAAWVFVNLSVVAYNQYFWYLDTFPEAFRKEKKHWRILFPGVW